jgi:AraC-like DNA-binding protein
LNRRDNLIPAHRLAGARPLPLVSKGHLNPQTSPPVARYSAPDDLADLVRHFWVPEWSLPDRQVVTASVLPCPALNLVIEPAGVTLNGPTTRRSLRTLTGRGWAVGALLRPAATLALGHEGPALVDRALPLDEPGLADRVAVAMTAAAPATARHRAAIGVVSDWLHSSATRIGEPGVLANAAVAVVERDPAVHRVADLAAALHVTPRTLQRALRRCTGFTPAEVIRRTRLQDAAHQLRHQDPALLARVAHDAGYADHAHMARDFRDVLDRTPSDVRDSE